MSDAANAQKVIELKDVEKQDRPARVSPDKDREVDITFKDLYYSVQVDAGDGKQKERVILDKVNGICRSGEVTAILGASGAGKTSLLNLLAQRIERTKMNRIEGKILANNLEYDFTNFPQFATYVMQDDRLMESLTVRECLQFAADLKMKGTQDEKDKRVSEIVRLMRLDRAQNTLIGGQFLKGVSGGERKRTSIGFEIVCEPQVILLDEPTSGLDSFTAYLLILVLSRYSRRNKTVVFTIHQPSADIWNLFDRVMLLVEGHLIYQGEGKEKIINYYKNIGFECPVTSNPADYLMQIMHGESQKNRSNYPVYYETYKKTLAPLVAKDIDARRQHEVQYYKTQNSPAYEIKRIAQRTIINMQRNPILLKARAVQSVILALFVSAIYYNLSNGYDNDATDIQAVSNKNGFLFFSTVNQFMLAMQPTILTFPAERNVFLKEANMRMYGLRAYFIGKTVPELPLLAILPIFYLVIVYWLVGLDTKDAGIFFTCYLIMLLLSMDGNSLGLACGAAFPDVRTAMAMVPLFLLPFMLFGGFYNNENSYVDWIGWLQYLSPFKFGFEALAFNQYNNTGFRPNPIELLGLKIGMWECVGIMVGLFVGYRIIAVYFLWKNTKKLQ